MGILGFETDTWLDLTVNLVPLSILGIFIVGFLAVPAWGVDPVFSGLQFAILGSMFVSLSILTYYAGRAIQGAESSARAAGDDGTVEDGTGGETPSVDGASD